jgi:hypothetical protein
MITTHSTNHTLLMYDWFGFRLILPWSTAHQFEEGCHSE